MDLSGGEATTHCTGELCAEIDGLHVLISVELLELSPLGLGHDSQDASDILSDATAVWLLYCVDLICIVKREIE